MRVKSYILVIIKSRQKLPLFSLSLYLYTHLSFWLVKKWTRLKNKYEIKKRSFSFSFALPFSLTSLSIIIIMVMKGILCIGSDCDWKNWYSINYLTLYNTTLISFVFFAAAAVDRQFFSLSPSYSFCLNIWRERVRKREREKRSCGRSDSLISIFLYTFG